MTKIEFDKKKWTGGMLAEYDYKEYMVVAPNFEDKTILLEDEDGSIGYKDCEKVEIIVSNLKPICTSCENKIDYDIVNGKCLNCLRKESNKNNIKGIKQWLKF